MLNSVQTLEFIEALNIIYNLSEGLTKKEIEDELGNKLSNVLVMFVKLESLGLIYLKEHDKIQI